MNNTFNEICKDSIDKAKAELKVVKDIYKNDKTTENFIELLKFSELFESYPRCRECSELMIYPNSTVRYSTNIFAVKHYGSQTAIKTVNDIVYSNSMCRECLLSKLPPKKALKQKLFNTFGEAVKIAFDIHSDELDIINKSRAVTLENMQNLYGDEEGKIRYDSYCKKQSDTNKFEHKKEKHGWTEEQFREFNLSRASTLENFIKRHGEEKGSEMWADYCKIQSETSTSEYINSTQSKERLAYIKIARNRSFDWCMLKCDNDEIKAKEMFTNIRGFDKNYSESSAVFFDLVIEKVKKLTDIQFGKPLMRKKELVLMDSQSNKKRYYDFCMMGIKLIVEYHGDMWHANPNKYGPEDITCSFYKMDNITAERVWANDERKKQIAEEAGFMLEVVWESERKTRLDEIVDLIVKLLNDKNTKENKIWDSSYSQ